MLSPNDVGQLTTDRNLNNYVRSIEWTRWGGSIAVGEGEVSLLGGSGATHESPPAGTSPVEVVLSHLKLCTSVPVYTAYRLKLAPGAAEPAHWPEGSSGRFPCSGILGAFYRSRPPRGRIEGCTVGLYEPRAHHGDQGGLSVAPVRWKPPLPGKGKVVLCDFKWSTWDGPGGRAQASGLLERRELDHGEDRIWPARFEWFKPAWCPGAQQGQIPISYTELRVAIYGSGRRPTKSSLSEYDNNGLPMTARSRQTFTPGPRCGFGVSEINPSP